jgi:hypothetical protein
VAKEKPVIPDILYRASKLTAVMPDIFNRASILVGFEWIS